MIEQINDIMQKIDHDTMGRLITYGGGGMVATGTQIAEASVADWALWLSAVAILGRLVFDVVKWLAERGRK